MTVNVETPHITYKGNDVATVFTFSWSFDDVSEIYVAINRILQVEGTTYELENVNLASGGEVRTTLTDPLTADDELLIYRRTPITQQVDYIEFDSFPAETHEGQMDKDTRILQEIITSGAAFGEGPVDLDSEENADHVEITNTSGSNAIIPLWEVDEDKAGVFAGEVTTSAPPNGTIDTHPDGYIYVEVAP